MHSEYEFMRTWESGSFSPFSLFPERRYPGVARRLEKTPYYDDMLGKLVGTSQV